MTTIEATNTDLCPTCRRDTSRFHLVSAHRTSKGLTAWIRCDCGSLHVVSSGKSRNLVATHNQP